uniref:RNase H type-1 domain-containing protein n=1 Tax=Gossypium raimondii TaxID=29730 RepID=A0A0D2RFM9_GOSRA|nr:hypothetical protein B456_005G152500 [Gossypium raimondii]
MVKCGDICWCKSGLGKLKCNVDGAIFTDNGCMGWAAVLRNDEGNFFQCISGFMKSTLSPFLLEIIVVQEALSWLKSLHVDNVIIETNTFHHDYEDALDTGLLCYYCLCFSIIFIVLDL